MIYGRRQYYSHTTGKWINFRRTPNWYSWTILLMEFQRNVTPHISNTRPICRDGLDQMNIYLLR